MKILTRLNVAAESNFALHDSPGANLIGNSLLYGTMGFVRKTDRASGLARNSKELKK